MLLAIGTYRFGLALAVTSICMAFCAASAMGRGWQPLSEVTCVLGEQPSVEEAYRQLSEAGVDCASRLPYYLNDEVWVRIKVPAKTATNERWLAISNRLINFHGAWAVNSAGSTPLTLRRNRIPMVAIDRADDPVSEVVLKVTFPFHTYLSVSLLDSTERNAVLNEDNIISQWTLAVCATMLIFNLFVFGILRIPSHAIYVLYATGGFCVVMGHTGIASSVMPAEVWTTFIDLSQLLTTIFAIIFTEVFLELRQGPRWLLYTNRTVAVLCGLSMALLAVGFRLSYLLLADFALALGSVVVVVVGVVRLRAGFQPARIYLIAWFILASSVIVWLMGNYHLLDTPFVASRSIPLGVAAEMLIISMALTYRVRGLRDDLIKAITDQNHILFQRIDRETQLVRQQQNQLVRTAKLSSLGTMAGGVAHEINNPLAIILATAELVSDNITSMKPADVQSRMSKIIDTVKRIQRITRGLLAFARQGGSNGTIYANCSSLLSDLEALLMSRLQGRSTRLRIQVTDAAKNCLVDATVTQQVLMNLLNNAVDATASINGATIELNVRREGDSIVFQVVDSGQGMTPEVAQRIFDPFFTTKEVGSGTGLGLPISAGLAEQIGGQLVLVATRPGYTEFQFTAPIQRAETTVRA